MSVELESGEVLGETGARARERRRRMRSEAYRELSEWRAELEARGWVVALNRSRGLGMAVSSRGGGQTVWIRAARWRVGRSSGEAAHYLVRTQVVEDFEGVLEELVAARVWVGRGTEAATRAWLLEGVGQLGDELAARLSASGAGGGAG